MARRLLSIKRGVTERGVFAFACQYIVSPRGRTGNRTVTQMRHPLLVEGRPNCARQSLASTLSAPHVAETSCCDPGRHANVITPCLLPGALRTLRKRAKEAEKGQERAISADFQEGGGQTPLKPPFVTPPFAAAQTENKIHALR